MGFDSRLDTKHFRVFVIKIQVNSKRNRVFCVFLFLQLALLLKGSSAE